MDGGAEDSPLLRGDKRLPTTEDGRACGKRVRPHRRWRAKAGVLGAVMFALAFAGLVAIFNVIQSTRTPRDSNSSLAEVGKRGQGAGSGQPTDSLDGGFEVPPQGARGKEHSPTRESQRKADGGVSPGIGGRVGGRGEKGAGGDAAAPGGKGGASAGRPNVFFIMVDDMGYNDIGYQSTDLGAMTPNLDKLAASGIKMTEYYSMSICTPSRAALMTGRYPVRYGMQYNVIQPGAPWGMPLTEKIMPQYMKDAGYETHMVGKWHIGSYTHAHTPHRRGFDTFLGYLNDEEMYWSHQSWTAKLNGRKFFDFGFGNQTDYYDIIDRSFAATPDWPVSDDDGDDTTGTTTLSSSESESFKGKYSTTVFHERTMDVLRSKTPHDEQPLFMYLAHQAVHDPLGVPPTDAFTSDEWAAIDALDAVTSSTLRTRFAKVLMYLDKTVGEMVEYLEKEGWMENSIIVVASDNGGCPSKGGSNYPLRGIKHSYWEGGNKVPAFVYSKSHLPEDVWGSTYAGMMHVTDWLPTLATASDVEIVGNHGNLDGIDHWQYLTDAKLVRSGASARKELLYNFDPYVLWADGDAIQDADFPLAQGALRDGKWKYMFSEWCSGWFTFDTEISLTDGLTNANNTCTVLGMCADCGRSCLDDANYTSWLFNLEEDPREEHNLLAEFPHIAGTMRERVFEIVREGYINSSYVDINSDSYYVWAKNNWWMMPWYELYLNADENPFNLTTSTSSSSSTTSSTTTISSSSSS